VGGYASRVQGIGPTFPSDLVFLEPFARAARDACIFEMRARLLADNTPATQKIAFTDLTPLVKDLLKVHGHLLTKGEKKAVRDAVVVRNKLLHLELSRATGKIVSLGVQLKKQKVWKLDIPTANDVPAAKPQAVRNLSTEEGRVFGWLLEGAQSGAFGQAQLVFIAGHNALVKIFKKSS
jgi:hypothetical protein